MTPLDTFAAAVRGVGRHPLRASLNIVGILAGVASIVLLIAVAQAVRAESKQEAAGLGSNLVVVYPSGVSSSGVEVGLNTGARLSTDDLTALANPGYVPDSVQTVPTAGVRSTVSDVAAKWQTDVIGSTEDFPSVRGYTMGEGRFFNGAEAQSAASVVVLGRTVVDNLLAGDPVGQLVLINNHPFKVIGVFAARGYSGSFNQDDLAVMPLQTAWATVLPKDAPRVDQVLIQAATANKTSAVKTEVTNTLLQRHHITNPAEADFQVRTQQDLLASSERVGTVMQWMLSVVAAIALLTGGIGIMSLLLGSVGERTYEIGIRRAVGAARKHILAQFLVEALLLSCIGGLAGLAVGYGAASFMGDIVTDLPAPIVTTTAVLVAIALAVVVGAVAGLYPAMRAANLEPAEAVRRI
jgi:putative ABC transport system permease protein